MVEKRIAAMQRMLGRITAKLRVMMHARYEGKLWELKISDSLTEEETRQFETLFVRTFKEIAGVTPQEELDWVPMEWFVRKHMKDSYDNYYYWALLWVEATRTALDYLAGYETSPERLDSDLLGEITINILAVFANPRGSSQLRLEAEDRVIRQCLGRSKHRENISLDIRHAATIDDVARALLEGSYRLVLFSGHGTGQGLAFENELGQVHVVPQNALAEFLQRYSPPIECVVLNACYTGVQANLISLGIPHTIGMDGAISDEAAIEFTRGFFDAIGAGKSIEFAYEEGCNRMMLKGFPESSIPVMLRSTG